MSRKVLLSFSVLGYIIFLCLAPILQFTFSEPTQSAPQKFTPAVLADGIRIAYIHESFQLLSPYAPYIQSSECRPIRNRCRRKLHPREI